VMNARDISVAKRARWRG